jgi:hypothetical protein
MNAAWTKLSPKASAPLSLIIIWPFLEGHPSVQTDENYIFISKMSVSIRFLAVTQNIS